MAKIANSYIAQGKSVLIVSHSNVSVDGVIKQVVKMLGTDKQSVLEDGKILRFGYVRDDELSQNPYATSFNYALSKCDSYDEMWNLNPTTKSINSSKSNNLPDWDTYFKKLAQQEYHSYQLMWKNDIVHKEFEKCAKEHINSDDIRYRVYRRGLEYPVFAEELKSIILPVYQSAQNCGFGRWKY